MAGPYAENEAEVLGRRTTHGTAARLTVSIVTPRGAQLTDQQADEIAAPGLLGEFGVLPGHIPFLTTLRAGVLALRAGGHRELLAVGPGYVQVGAANRLQVLVESAIRAEDIDVEAARRELAELSAEMKAGGKQGADFDVLLARVEWARARVDAWERAHAKGAH